GRAGRPIRVERRRARPLAKASERRRVPEQLSVHFGPRDRRGAAPGHRTLDRHRRHLANLAEHPAPTRPPYPHPARSCDLVTPAAATRAGGGACAFGPSTRGGPGRAAARAVATAFASGREGGTARSCIDRAGCG